MTDDLFTDLTNLKVACITLTELFKELVICGMTEDQALTLLSKIIRSDRGNEDG